MSFQDAPLMTGPVTELVVGAVIAVMGRWTMPSLLERMRSLRATFPAGG